MSPDTIHPPIEAPRRSPPTPLLPSTITRGALILLPSAAALGPFLPVAGPFFAYRVMVLALAFAALLPGMPGRRGRVAALPLILIWTLFLIGGMIDAPDYDLAMKMALAVSIGLLCILALERLAFCVEALRFLELGWIVAFIVTGTLGLRESLTGIHYGGYLSTVELARVDTRLVASVFGNPNAFAVFLVMSQPFLHMLALGAKRSSVRLIGVGLIGLNFVLVLVTGSRLGLAATVIQLGLFMLLHGGTRSATSLVAATIGIVTLSSVGVLDKLIPLLPGKVAPFLEILLNGGSGLSQDASGVGRLNLYRDGIWLLQESWGLGLGPGAYQWNLLNSELPYPTGNVGSPHNGYLEIAVEFSALTLLALLIWLVRAANIFVRSRKNEALQNLRANALLASMGGISIMCLANSSFLSSATTWMWLSTIGAYAAALSLDDSRVTPVRRHP